MKEKHSAIGLEILDKKKLDPEITQKAGCSHQGIQTNFFKEGLKDAEYARD